MRMDFQDLILIDDDVDNNIQIFRFQIMTIDVRQCECARVQGAGMGRRASSPTTLPSCSGTLSQAFGVRLDCRRRGRGSASCFLLSYY